MTRSRIYGALMTAAVLGLAPSAPAAIIYGYGSDNVLISFDSAAPGTILSSVAVTGRVGGETLGAIDFRPATGGLYALNEAGTRLYAIDTGTGVATQVGADGQFNFAGPNGMDFNPTVDRIRVVNGADQNARIHPGTGALVATDVNLAYAAGDANAGANPNVTAVAYINNFAGAVSTTLYGIDTNGRLVTINPPNNGVLNTVGPLGITPNANRTHFDIDSTGAAFAATVVTAGRLGNLDAMILYTINLNTGGATQVGLIGDGSRLLNGIAAVPAAVPEPATAALAGLGLAGLLAVRRFRK